MAVILGSVVLADYEIPEKISFGGQQAMLVHKLIGGDRVVDAMGPDDADIGWSGLFFGPNALQRARRLDGFRKAGAELPLMWGGLFYLVVIAEFKADFERFYQIPYEIRCTVVSSGSPGLAGPIPTLDDLIGGDLTSALSFAGVDAVASAAVAGLSAAVDAAGVLQGAASSVLAPVATAAASAQSAIGSAMAAADSAVSTASLGGIVAGGFPTDMANTFLGQVASMDNAVSLLSAQSAVGRIQVNIAQGAA